MPIRCFWVEPEGTARLVMAVTCAACDERVEVDAGVFPYDRTNGGGRFPEWEELDWPTSCAKCGREFEFDLNHEPHDHRSTSGRSYYRAADGRVATLGEFGAGAMWEAPWMGEYMRGDDGRCIVVRVPGNHDWIIDSRASNCGRKDDKTHHCWCRHGEPPNLTVDKNCDTCQAGAGSFWANMPHGWHGHLTSGWLHLPGEAVPPAPPVASRPGVMGRRLPDRTWPDVWPEDRRDGDFWYVHGGPYDDKRHNRKGHWCCQAPGGHTAALANWVVEEHEDGLISVLPIPGGEPNSIKISTTRPDAAGNMQEVELWHGFIHHGEWRHV